MATVQWLGGAAAAAQVTLIALNNDSVNGDIYTITLTDENGGTATVQHTASGVDETIHAAALQSAAAGSSNVLFQAITWTVASNVITATARVAGVPFYVAVTVTGSATTTVVTTTASAGPNDWNTTKNWDTNAKPVSGDDVVFADSPHDVYYGLDQSAVDLNTLRVASTYTGTIGQPSKGFHLQIDVSNTDGKAVLNGRGAATMIEGTIDEIDIIGGIRSQDMVSIGFGSTIQSLRVLGTSVLGTVTLENAISIDKIFMINCPSATVTLGINATNLNEVVVTAGTFNSSSPIEATTVATGEVTEPGSLTVSGGVVNMFKSSPARNVIQTGGTVNWRGSGTLGDALDGDAFGLKLYGGTFSIDSSNVKSVTIVDAEVYGGVFTERSGSAVVTYTNDLKQYGGDVKYDSSSALGVTR
jgi:hypothetical protein